MFGRKPEPQDEPLWALAEMFAKPEFTEEVPTPGVEFIDKSRLDFSVESLLHVDEYLDEMRRQPLPERGKAYLKVVLRSGAYTGEVVRRNSKTRDWHWLDYQGALKVNKRLADFGDPLGGAAVLWDGRSGLAFPLAKVQKYLENGREDSLHFFAGVIVGQSS